MNLYTGPLTDLYELDAEKIVRDYACGHCHGPLETKPAESGKKGPIGHPLLTVYCPKCGQGYTPVSKKSVLIAKKEEKLYQQNLRILAGIKHECKLSLEERIKKLYPD